MGKNIQHEDKEEKARASGGLTDLRTSSSELWGEFAGQGPKEKFGAQREAGFRNLRRWSHESLAMNPPGCLCKEPESRERTARIR